MATPHLKPLCPISLSAGRYLKKARLRLGLCLRDVQDASAILAAEENNQELHISAARLVQIENEPSVPGVFKLLGLSAIYGLDFLDILRRYGVIPDRVHHYRNRLQQTRTHPISTSIHNMDTMITVPARLDPSFRWETTQLLNRVVALWGEIPAALLVGFNPRRHIYGYVGLEDQTMFPLLRPGALVMVDGNRRRVIQKEWGNEHERPIYFIEMRDGYRCAWCQLEEGRLTLIPHPMSSVPAESFNYPGEAEIVGQVVGMAMRLVPAEAASVER